MNQSTFGNDRNSPEGNVGKYDWTFLIESSKLELLVYYMKIGKGAICLHSRVDIGLFFENTDGSAPTTLFVA